MAVSVPPEAHGAVPPHNLEAETSVLGAILISEQALDALLVDVNLQAEDFYRDRHREIYRAMLRLKEKSAPEAVDVVTICEELDRAGQLEAVGGRAYVHSLPSLVAAAGNAPHYARIVKGHALMRRLLETTRDIQEKVYSYPGEPRELVEEAEARLFKVAHDDRTGDPRSIEDVLHDELDKLERLSREEVSLTGTPSGFKDLDEKTGGFQPGNLIVLAARPSMGKCLTGSTLVYDPSSGARRPISEVVARGERGEDVWVAALGADFRLRPARATAFLRSGRQPVLRITTRLGRRIEATANHPLLTVGGWRELRTLEPGARIAVPRSLPRSGEPSGMPDHELVLLAALIADGNLTQRTPRFCFDPDSPVLSEVQRAVAAMGLRLSRPSHGTAAISAGRGAGSNPARELCERHGLWGLRSAEKFVPDAVFELEDDAVARFLAVLYGCDGHLYASDRLRQIGYTSISERLAHDVQHLLLRLGIVSRVRTLSRPVYEGTGRCAREVLITGQAGLTRFCERIPVCGKAEKIAQVVAGLAGVGSPTNTDTVPPQLWDRVREVEGSRPRRALSLAAGHPADHNRHVGSRGVSRPQLAKIAAWSGDPALEAVADSDVWWDEIATIEPAGEQETFDLTVPGVHNFVAGDVVVHNSALVTNIAENAAVEHGKAVALFSLEMSETELAQRFIASQAKEDGDSLRKGRVRQDRWQKIIRATQKLAAAPLFVDDSSDIGILELRAKARRLHAKHELGLVIVDYLQLMRPEPGVDSRVEQIGQISRGLKILARELEIPVIAVSQLSRAVESRPDKRPLLSDLRESGQIEQDADLVVFIFRDEYYNRDSERPGIADLIIAKHRNGPVGEVELTFLSRYPKFANLAREPVGAMAGAGPAFGDGAP